MDVGLVILVVFGLFVVAVTAAVSFLVWTASHARELRDVHGRAEPHDRPR